MNWQAITFDWNNTRAFLVTAEEGTLSSAAKALGLTQPTLSRQVYALEKQLGVTLFERVGQRLVLTESGLALLEHAQTMGEAAQKFSLTANGQSQKLEGKVVISTGQLDAVFRLPKILAKLRQQEPGIEIEVVVTNDVSDLKRREADIAIRNFRPTQNDLIAKIIGHENIGLYGSTSYLNQIKEGLEQSNIQIIGFDNSSAIIELLDKQGWQLTKRNFGLITSFQLMQIELCKQGLGLIFFPEDLGEKQTGLFKAYKHKEAVMQIPVWLVCHQELRTNLRVKRVFDCLAKELRQSLS